MTGQSQSEISEILNGRRVNAYDVLVRIADGLGVPRGHLGLAHDEVPFGTDDLSMVRPVQDPVSGQWVVRVPVFVDSYGAAVGLCESIGTTHRADGQAAEATTPDEIVARRWRGRAGAILGA